MTLSKTNPKTSNVVNLDTRPDWECVVDTPDVISSTDKAAKFYGIDPVYVCLLRHRTPYKHEDYIAKIVRNVSARTADHISTDSHGNVKVQVFSKGKEIPKVLFNAHMDTVHTQPGYQALWISKDRTQLVAGASKDSKSGQGKVLDRSILGADDKTGVFILLRMIHSKVPGTYMFWVGEERGMIGAKGKMKDEPDFFKKFDHAIEFDRMNKFDIINSQRGQKSTSDEFSKELSERFNDLWIKHIDSDGKKAMLFKPARGTATDTAEMMKVIPECTNISVGYYNQHTNREYQDIDHLKKLLKIIPKLNWEGLPAKRDPTVTHYNYTGSGHHSPTRHSIEHINITANTSNADIKPWNPTMPIPDCIAGDRALLGKLLMTYYGDLNAYIKADVTGIVDMWQAMARQSALMHAMYSHIMKTAAADNNMASADTFGFLSDIEGGQMDKFVQITQQVLSSKPVGPQKKTQRIANLLQRQQSKRF